MQHSTKEIKFYNASLAEYEAIRIENLINFGKIQL